MGFEKDLDIPRVVFPFLFISLLFFTKLFLSSRKHQCQDVDLLFFPDIFLPHASPRHFVVCFYLEHFTSFLPNTYRTTLGIAGSLLKFKQAATQKGDFSLYLATVRLGEVFSFRIYFRMGLNSVA